MTRSGKDADQMLQAQVCVPSRVEKEGEIHLFDFDGLLVYELQIYMKRMFALSLHKEVVRFHPDFIFSPYSKQYFDLLGKGG